MPYWRLFYHFVWGTKNRELLIVHEWERSLHNVIVAKAQALGAFVYRAGGTDDHIHLVASIPPKIALSTFIGQVKGNSSHFCNHELNLDVPFAWQAEYGVVSFGGQKLDWVVQYVMNQREHHGQGTTFALLEKVGAAQDRGAESPR